MIFEVLDLQLKLLQPVEQVQNILEQDWQKPYSIPVQNQYTLQEGSMPDLPAHLWQPIKYDEAEVLSQTPEGWLHLKCQQSHMSIHFHRQQIWCSGTGGALRLCLQFGIMEMLRLQGWMPIHASALNVNGAATVLLGPSGTGKTTTLLQAARSGVVSLAEDWSWIGPELVFYPWDSGLHLLPDTTERFADVLPEARTWVDRGSRKKWRFEVQDLPWFAPEPCPLGHFWLLKRSPKTALGPLSKLDQVKALWEATGMPLTRAGTVMAQQGINRLMGVPGQTLHLGFDVDFQRLLNGN